ncbi:YncE family protein [Xanthobacter variabilis]|uniref:YncE family protein n=1 Tax=Xanthobacter variabilis TaxID=3119932 RepID=UPI00374F3B0B
MRRAFTRWGAAALMLTVSAAPALAGAALVVCQGGNEIGVVDTARLALTARIAVPPAPAGIALAPDGRSAYVTHPDAGMLTRIDTARGRASAGVAIGGQPFGIAVDPDGGALYVSDWSADRVRRLDADTFAETGSVAVGHAPAGLALDARRRELYSADREAGAVSIIDLGTFKRVASVPVGEGPYSFDTSDAPRRLLVVNVRGGDVSAIDKASREVSRHGVGKMPYGVASAPTGEALVANQQSGSLTLLPAENGDARTLRVGGSPEAVRLDPQRRLAYVTDWFSDQLLVIDLDAFRVAARVAVCKGPRSLILMP